jgi:hypothetical protein
MPTHVRITDWRGPQIVTLASALTPSDDRDGQVEQAQATATAACEAIGRLLAHLVEEDKLTLEDAAYIAGEYRDIEPLED